jgi:pilus assembly protein Flp/PilA
MRRGRPTVTLFIINGVENMERLKKFLRDEHGASMPEYALLVALIAIVVIAGATILGNAVNNKIAATGNAVTAAGS